MKTRNISPLRYPGGKSKLTKFLIDLIKFNDLEGCTYIEPFAGGAGIAFGLLVNGIVDNIIINDYDRAIYAFWHSVLNRTEEFCNTILSTPITISEWHKQKKIYLNSDDLFELGFATFFLNRTNRSGIIKGGAIGGLQQNGKYKIDCRFNKTDLINRIKIIALHKEQIKLYCMDASEFIKNVLPKVSNYSLVYLDPPYYQKGPGLYTNFYNKEDHKYLSDSIKNHVKQPWIVTYDNVKEISNLYRNYRQSKYYLNYSANKSYTGQEILIYSDNIIPVVSPNLKYVI